MIRNRGSYTPEERLWQAVVVQTVQDALSTGNPESEYGRRVNKTARRVRVYMETSSDWRDVCVRAGTTPEYVARLFKEGKLIEAMALERG